MDIQELINQSVVIERPAKKSLINLAKLLPENSLEPLKKILETGQEKIRSHIETYLLAVHEAFAEYKRTVLQIKGLKVFEKSEVIKNVNVIENAMIDKILETLV
ncbi:hypothetical protein JW962_03495 [Candidatus Dojkabacteria bacterium]|nr:hypothetical protein [Candidatus Dojkabacteria bacterium]